MSMMDDDEFELEFVQDLLHQKHPDKSPPSSYTCARKAAAAISGHAPEAKSAQPQASPGKGARRERGSNLLFSLAVLGWIFAFAVCLSLGLQSLWQGNTGRTALRRPDRAGGSAADPYPAQKPLPLRRQRRGGLRPAAGVLRPPGFPRPPLFHIPL